MATLGFKHCPDGHLLGQMRRNASGVDLLELFREAIDHGQEMPAEVDVIGVFSGGQRIRCSICGGVVDWHPTLRPRRYAARVAFE